MREIIRLVSTAGTGYFKTTMINKKNAAGKKLSKRCYDPIIRKHVEFIEKKIK